MRKMIFNLMTVVFVLVFLPGCLTYKEQTIHFDYETGVLQMDFRDLRSIKDEKGAGDDLEKDWAELKKDLEKKDEFDPDVVEVKTKELFEEKDALSGKAVYQVKCPKCFPSKVDLLRTIYEDGRWELINDEIYLIINGPDYQVSTNGQLLKTGKSVICVWPQDEKVFEFAFTLDQMQGDSLLPKYLSETETSKK